MRKILSLALLLSLAACQKEISLEIPGDNTGGTGGGTGTSSLIGTWKFVNLQATTYVEAVTSFAGSEMKNITKSSYTSKENSGTYVFTASKVTANNIAYSIDTVAVALTYLDGILQDSTSFPFQLPLATYANTFDYKLVGTDSLVATGGSVPVNSAGSGSVIAPTTLGYKYKISGSTLTLSLTYSRDTTIVSAGTSAKVKQVVSTAVHLSK